MIEKRGVVMFCVCFLLYLSSLAESKHIPKEVDSSDGCKVGSKFYRVGEQWSPRGVCQRNTCRKGGSITAVTCPLINIPEDSKCYLTAGDASKSWTDCCGQVICPPENQ